MAYIEDIPKYGLGTSHIIDNGPSDWPEGDNSESSQSNNKHLPRISEKDFKELFAHAIKLGCRHFDCAPIYGTQKIVGECLAEAVKEVPRQRLFITSKLPPNMMRPEKVTQSIKQSIEDLQCCYLDLFLVHAPFATEHISDDDYYPVDEQGNVLLDAADNRLEDTWRMVAHLKKIGLTRYVGLSNITPDQLTRLHEIYPVDVVQNEYHIYNQNREMFDFCEEIDVHFEAYAVLGNPNKSKQDSKPNCMSDPTVLRVAKSHGLTPTETIIQWIHYQPLSYVIKCDTKQQLDEIINATKHEELDVNILIELDSLDRKIRVHTFQEHVGITDHPEYPFRESHETREGPS